MASPSPTQKAAAYQRRSNVLLTAVSGACVCLLVVALACDPHAHFHTHLAIAFAISTTLFAPIDRAQVQLQTHDAHPRIGSKDAPHPTTTFGCVARVLKEQGWLALWRGNLANVLKKVLTALVSGCIIRITFQAFRHVVPLNQGSVREGLAQQLVAHGIAAIAWTALLYPFEYIHTRMAVDSGKSRQFTGILDCLQKTVTREGLYAPFKGLQLALYELAVCQGLESVLYVGMSKFLDSRAGLKMLEKMSRVDRAPGYTATAVEPLSAVEPLYTGLLYTMAFLMIPLMHLMGSCLSGLLSYPLETVRRRVILQVGADDKQYSSALQCSKRTIEEEGIAGFYKGVSAKALLTAACALMSSALLDWLSTHQPEGTLPSSQHGGHS